MTLEPKWEMTEQGWRAVAFLTDNCRWHAYVENIAEPHSSIWSDKPFESLLEAQEWCKAEIAHCRKRHNAPDGSSSSVSGGAAPAQDAWEWLWSTLEAELGSEHAARIRQEFARRKRAEAR